MNHTELDYLHDQIFKQSKMIQSIVDKLPSIAAQKYITAKLVDELMSTNEIEGVRSTKAEMETVIEIVVRKESMKKNNVRHLSLMNSYYNLLLETQRSLRDIEQIRTIYDNLVGEEIKEENQLDGELFRKQSIEIVTQTQKVVHKGVYPEQGIHNHLSKLIRYLNEDHSPMLYRIAISLYYFGYIHPFYDGNGRTSRYISSMYLLNELDLLTALTLSYAINKSKQMYADAFDEGNNSHNKGELTFFCEVFFQIIDKAQNEILVDLFEKHKKVEHLASMVKEINISDELSKNILYILGQNFIFGIEGKGMTRKELMAITEKTEYVINKALEGLNEAGFIEYLKRRPIEVTLCGDLCAYLK